MCRVEISENEFSADTINALKRVKKRVCDSHPFLTGFQPVSRVRHGIHSVTFAQTRCSYVYRW
jgi:hypothetical protein